MNKEEKKSLLWEIEGFLGKAETCTTEAWLRAAMNIQEEEEGLDNLVRETLFVVKDVLDEKD